MQGPYVDCSKPFKKTKECHECGEKFRRGDTKEIVEIVDDPWATKPRIVAFHSDNEDDNGTCLDKMTDTSWADFRYFICAQCDRIVARQCGSDGWRSYVKILDDEEVCVRCYQELRLAEGEPADAFEAGRVPGDFYSDSDLSINGWSLVPGYHGVHITGEVSAKRFCKQALLLIKAGHKVLSNYDSMGIGGSEGYVSLYAKGGAS